MSSTLGATYTSVNNGNLDALALDSILVELVNLGHQVRSISVRLIVPLAEGRSLIRRANPVDNGFGDVVELHRPHVLNGRRRGNLEGLLLGIVNVVELDRDTLEQLVVEFQAGLALLANPGVEVGRVLYYCQQVFTGLIVRESSTFPSSNSKM